LTGVFPTIFAVTGIIKWLRKRAARRGPMPGAPALYCGQPSERDRVSMTEAERIDRSIAHYCCLYRAVLAGVLAASLILPSPLLAQSTPDTSPSPTTAQTAPATSEPVPSIQPAALPDIALKLPRDLSPWGMFMAADI